jgi:hypothetical protein
MAASAVAGSSTGERMVKEGEGVFIGVRVPVPLSRRVRARKWGPAEVARQRRPGVAAVGASNQRAATKAVTVEPGGSISMIDGAEEPEVRPRTMRAEVAMTQRAPQGEKAQQLTNSPNVSCRERGTAPAEQVRMTEWGVARADAPDATSADRPSVRPRRGAADAISAASAPVSDRNET